jgi:methoxymalonate biosynthesis acyl carrier protein
MAGETVEVAAAIRDWLHENVVGGRTVSEDYPLIDNGVLTSLHAVELVMFLENEFGVTIDDEEVVETNFGSIRAIAELVVGKKV